MRPTRCFVFAFAFLSFAAAASVEKAVQELTAGNFEAAKTELEEPVKAGDPRALTLMGVMLDQGHGFPRDAAKAVEYFRRASDLGFGPAMFRMGVAYMTGRGIARDPKEAVRFITGAAEHGEAEAQLVLWSIYRESDAALAAGWLQKAATAGLRRAQFLLGLMYAQGDGVPKNPEESFRWIKLAAEAGEPAAEGMVGRAYRSGEFVEKDPMEAATWTRKGAESRHALSQMDLARCYRDGVGEVRDNAEAFAWMDLAISNAGDEQQRKAWREEQDALKAKLNADDLVKAGRLVKQYAPRFGRAR